VQGPIGGGVPGRPSDKRVKAWRRRWCSGTYKRQDGHRRVWRGSCEQEEGKERSYDVTEEEEEGTTAMLNEEGIRRRHANVAAALR
jgi:hypothetical protein